MLAKPLVACTYLSSIVSQLYATMLKSMRKSKNRYFYHIFVFCIMFPWGRPWGNHAKCCMDGKRIRCLQIVSLHVPHLPITICEIERDICEKILILSYPLHSTPPLGGFPSEYCHPVWYGKTRMVGLPEGEKNFEDMCNHLGTIPACDRQTSCHSIVRAMHTRRAVI